MTEDNTERPLGLSPAQVAGSALAAVTAAVFASFAGTAGTIIGAALGSVVATIGAAAYTAWLRRTSAAVRRTATQVRQTSVLTGTLPRKVTDGPLRPDKRLSGAEDDVDGEADGDSDGDGDSEEGFNFRLLPWRKIALSTVAVLVTTLGGITAVEAITGQPISALLGVNDSTGTTLGHVSGGDDNKRAPTEDDNTEGPSPSPQPTTTTPDDEATPTQDADPADPADPGTTPARPTPTPSAPADGGTEAPDGVTGE